MDTTRQDFIVGLVIVGAIAVVVGALLATSGWGERHYDLYLRTASAEGLTADSKVLLQGLQVGRVMSVSPRVDSTTRTIAFVARLSMIERFKGGATIRVPLGTRAELEPATPISSTVVIKLVLPDTTRPGVLLKSGDTIESVRKPPIPEQLAAVAQHLSSEVEAVLHASEKMLTRVEATVARTDTVLQDVTPSVETTLTNVAATMGRVNKLVQRLDPGLADSVSGALGVSNRLLSRMDSLVSRASEMTAENRKDVRTAVANLTELTRQLNHLADEVARRPYRLLIGMKPLAPDSTHSSEPRDSVRP